ncbi:uncharacterized protein [Dermacentor albipictus]|uniref:uncharacterized protein isoform X2 n=1 Tax=Dermacentor albipictus TaxID=60249 RepID=UPI0038FC96F0
MFKLGIPYATLLVLTSMNLHLCSGRTLNAFVRHYEPLSYQPVDVHDRATRWKRSAYHGVPEQSVKVAFTALESGRQRVHGGVPVHAHARPLPQALGAPGPRAPSCAVTATSSSAAASSTPRGRWPHCASSSSAGRVYLSWSAGTWPRRGSRSAPC